MPCRCFEDGFAGFGDEGVITRLERNAESHVVFLMLSNKAQLQETKLFLSSTQCGGAISLLSPIRLL